MSVCHLFSSFYSMVAFLFAIVVPPLGVIMRTGINKDVVINLLLTGMGYIPGVIHALWILLTVPTIGSAYNQNITEAADALKKEL